MLIDLLILVLGLAILLAGGETLVRGASSLARGLGVSHLAIGLTVVAFGTSAPELAVNIGAALSDAGDLSFGNIFGSNLANIGLIVGLVAVLNPLPIQNIVIRRELPMLLLATTAAAVLAFDLQVFGLKPHYDRTDGVVLLLFFVVFLYYTLGEMMRPRMRNGRRDAEAEAATGAGEFSALAALPSAEDECTPAPSIPRDLLLSIAGLAALIWGADFTVDGAVGLARVFGVSEVIIGLTMVAVGTSLPELATALIALRHDKVDMAVGGVVGSNIFNTLLVAGVTSSIHPMTIPETGYYDLGAVAVLSLYLTLVGSTHRQRVIRWEGMALLGLYATYITWRTVQLA